MEVSWKSLVLLLTLTKNNNRSLSMQHGLCIFGIAVAIQRIFTHCTVRIAKFFVYSAFQLIYRNYTQMIGNKLIKHNSTLKLQLA